MVITKFPQAQTLTFTEVDKHSFELYKQQKWDSLIDYIHATNNAGIDYYYLQARLGAALYEKKKYRSAAFTFQKALKYNSADSYAKNSLYYSLLNSANTTASRYLSGKSKSIKNATDTLGYNKMGFVYVEGGVKICNKKEPLGNINYFNLGLRHSLGRRITLYHAFSFLVQTKHYQQIKQSGYYLGAWIQLGVNWKICPSVHFFWINISEQTETPLGPPRPPVNSSKTNEQAYSIVIQRSFRIFDLGAMASYNNFDVVKAGQFGGYITLYPFGSNVFSATTTAVYHTRKMSAYQTVLKETVNLKLFKFLWLTGEFAYGNEQVQLQPESAFPANNSLDPNNYRYSILLTSPVSKSVSLYGFYQHEDKNENTTNVAYTFNSLIFGLKIKL
ncbi:MAG: hypothetical protein AB7P01_03355 [Bacteroidia bacterium]